LKFDLRRPCGNCPFRHDIRPFLTVARATEIVEALAPARPGGGQTFTCHKTTVNADDDDEDGGGRRVDGPNAQHCAGALIMLEKAELLMDNQMLRIAMRLGLFDPTILDLNSPVFGDPEDFIDAQESHR